MVKRRSKIEVCLSILKAIRMEETARPTRIMYKSNLSWAPLQSILNSMTKNGFIEVNRENSGRRVYRLTSAGLRTIEVLEAAQNVIDKINWGESSGRAKISHTD